MTTTTARAPAARKTATEKRTRTKKVDLDKLSDKELMALDEATYLASLPPWLRKVTIASKPLRGVFDKELAKCK